ncbi:MAG: Spy/CpxP family protein refolding chaperone [Thermodesulfobacteriota bacterium]
MKTRNKVFIGSGIGLLVLIITGFGLVSAYGPWGYRCGPFPPGFQARAFHSPALKGDMAEFFLWRMDKMAGELKLNPAQKAKYETIRENLKNHFIAFHGEHQQMRERFHQELEKENPDISWMIGTARTKLNDFSGFMNKNLDRLQDFYASLDSRQKALISQEIRERMKYHRS